MAYKVVLRNCAALSESSVKQAQRAFGMALERALACGPAGVAQAHKAYAEVIRRYGGTPLPIDAPAWDRDIADRWEDALSAGGAEAFTGWGQAPAGAAFEVFSEGVPA